MRTCGVLVVTAAAAVILAGCETVPPGAERGPQGTIAYDVVVDASAPGARVEANGAFVGNTPVHIKIFGNKDGTFHDFGSYYYVIRALPLATNQFVQTTLFRTGHGYTPEDHVPSGINFDMNQKTQVYAPLQAPGYYAPVYAPPYYYGPWFYGPPWYYGPRVRVYYGPRYPHHW